MNAACLIEYDGKKFLIDGIYDENNHQFSNLSANQWEDLKNGSGCFANIDYLLFTHEHGDHFSAQMTMEYIQYQKPRAIFMQKNGTNDLKILAQKAMEKGIACIMLDETFCKEVYFQPEKNIKIKAFHTAHLDNFYKDVEHFCYIIQFDEKKILITADADFMNEDFEAVKDVDLDIVFVNPFLYASKKGRDLIQNGPLHARRVIVYHIPFLDDDEYGLRKMTEMKAENDGINVKLFLERNEEVVW